MKPSLPHRRGAIQESKPGGQTILATENTENAENAERDPAPIFALSAFFAAKF